MARDGEDGSPPRERAALQFAAGATRVPRGTNNSWHPESAAKNKEIARCKTYIARLKSKLGRSSSRVRHGHSQVPLTDIESGEGAAGVAPRAAAPAGGDAETGWESIQPDPNPPFVSLSSTVRLLGCPGAMECGQLCTRLPIFCLFGIFIAPAVYFLGLAAVLVLLLLVLCLGCPCGIALAWLFPRCWPGFKPPSEVAWKAAKALQTLRVVTYTNPKPAEWNAEQLADKRQLKTALLRYAIAIRVPVSAEQEPLASVSLGQISYLG